MAHKKGKPIRDLSLDKQAQRQRDRGFTPQDPTKFIIPGRTEAENKEVTNEQFNQIQKLEEFRGKGGQLNLGSEQLEFLDPVVRDIITRKQTESALKLEEAGAFEQATPRIENIDLFGEAPKDFPIVGPSSFALSQSTLQAQEGEAKRGGVQALLSGVGGNIIINSLRDLTKDFRLEKIKGKEAFGIPETPETIREAALRQIKINSFNEGITVAEEFGSTIEGIPIIGNRARAWADGLIEQPSTNVQEVLDSIAKIASTATNLQEKVRSNQMEPIDGMIVSRRNQEQLAKLEGRLKLLIQTSPVLKANRDQVDAMVEELFDAQTRVDNFRNTAAFALTAELTGTGRITPTDEEMFFSLRDSRK